MGAAAQVVGLETAVWQPSYFCGSLTLPVQLSLCMSTSSWEHPHPAWLLIHQIRIALMTTRT